VSALKKSRICTEYLFITAEIASQDFLFILASLCHSKPQMANGSTLQRKKENIHMQTTKLIIPFHKCCAYHSEQVLNQVAFKNQLLFRQLQKIQHGVSKCGIEISQNDLDVICQ